MKKPFSEYTFQELYDSFEFNHRIPLFALEGFLENKTIEEIVSEFKLLYRGIPDQKTVSYFTRIVKQAWEHLERAREKSSK